MRRDFYGIYRNLEDRYGSYEYLSRFGPEALTFGAFGGLQPVEDAISGALFDLQLPSEVLRPDARLFLMVNMHQMIALPLAASNSPIPGAEMRELLRNDVRTILETASEHMVDKEISGHVLFNAISQVWDKLRATQLDVWG